jgi:hypothetical protein
MFTPALADSHHRRMVNNLANHRRSSLRQLMVNNLASRHRRSHHPAWLHRHRKHLKAVLQHHHNRNGHVHVASACLRLCRSTNANFAIRVSSTCSRIKSDEDSMTWRAADGNVEKRPPAP